MSSNNYIYDEAQPSGHGFSFSHKLEYDLTSPKAKKLASRLEKNEDQFSNRTNAHKSTNRGGRSFDLSPELTLDDLREKLKAGGTTDHNPKRPDDLSDILQSSSRAPENKGLNQSISPKANQRKHTPGKESQFEGSDYKDSYRPYSSQAYRSPKGSYQKDGLLSSSPYQTYTQSISSYLKSPTRNIYNNGDLSDRIQTNYSEQEQSLKYSKSHKYNPMTHLTDGLRSRSSTPKKDKLGYTDTKLYFGGSTYLLNSNNENSQSLQQELKAKIEQFNKKLMEVQEGLGQSKSSQDPYQISLRSMKPLPNEDLLDGSLRTGKGNQKAPLSSVGDENSKNLGNKEDRNQPLNIHNLTETQKSASDVSQDYSHKFQQMKLKYADMFKPQEMKAMTNPYKILRHRFDKKLDGLVKDYVDQTTVLQSEIDKNLFFTTTK